MIASVGTVAMDTCVAKPPNDQSKWSLGRTERGWNNRVCVCLYRVAPDRAWRYRQNSIKDNVNCKHLKVFGWGIGREHHRVSSAFIKNGILKTNRKTILSLIRRWWVYGDRLYFLFSRDRQVFLFFCFFLKLEKLRNWRKDIFFIVVDKCNNIFQSF